MLQHSCIIRESFWKKKVSFSNTFVICNFLEKFLFINIRSWLKNRIRSVWTTMGLSTKIVYLERMFKTFDSYTLFDKIITVSESIGMCLPYSTFVGTWRRRKVPNRPHTLLRLAPRRKPSETHVMRMRDTWTNQEDSRTGDWGRQDGGRQGYRTKNLEKDKNTWKPTSPIQL